MTIHGGNLDEARRKYGGKREDWFDLSTGINPHSYPLPRIKQALWSSLPDTSGIEALKTAAINAYRSELPCLPLTGVQAAIQIYPRVLASLAYERNARVFYPSYVEHEDQLNRAGWNIERVNDFTELAGGELAVVVNPNNPDGKHVLPEYLLTLSEKVGFLVVDESFCDMTPDLSICPHLSSHNENVLVLRSFGKFYGLAGLRLGFVIGGEKLLNHVAAVAGSWSVSGPALAVGCEALNDGEWAKSMAARLKKEAASLDMIAVSAGWRSVGGTSLFRLFDVKNSKWWQKHLAQHQIWSRTFAFDKRWIRLGIPPEKCWKRLENALQN